MQNSNKAYEKLKLPYVLKFFNGSLLTERNLYSFIYSSFYSKFYLAKVFVPQQINKWLEIEIE